MAFKVAILAITVVSIAAVSAADSAATTQISSSTPTWTQIQKSKVWLLFRDHPATAVLS